MPRFLDDAPDWSEFDTYPTASAAEVDAAYLRSEGIPARVTHHGMLPGMPGKAMLWVDRERHEKARWLLKFPPVTEAELDFLATGELPKTDEPV